MKKILIYILTLILTLISTLLIVYIYPKIKTNHIVCNLTYKNENYDEVSKINIYYKNNKIIKYNEELNVSSSDKDLLKYIKEEYTKDNYNVKVKNNNLIISKQLTTKLKYNELIKEYTKVGYTCK